MSEAAAPLDLARLLRVLSEHDVEFVVVGGLAAITHGARRMTLDLDIVPCPEPANFQRLASAIAELGVTDEEVVDGEFHRLDPRDDVDLARSRNLALRTDAGRLDVLNRARGAPAYAELGARSMRVEMAGVPVRVVGLDDLVTMKLALHRPKDLQDVADVTAHEAREYPSPTSAEPAPPGPDPAAG